MFGTFEQFGYENASRIVQGASFALGVLSLFLLTGGLSLLTVLALLAGSHVLAAQFLLASLRRFWGSLNCARQAGCEELAVGIDSARTG